MCLSVWLVWPQVLSMSVNEHSSVTPARCAHPGTVDCKLRERDARALPVLLFHSTPFHAPTFACASARSSPVHTATCSQWRASSTAHLHLRGLCMCRSATGPNRKDLRGPSSQIWPCKMLSQEEGWTGNDCIGSSGLSIDPLMQAQPFPVHNSWPAPSSVPVANACNLGQISPRRILQARVGESQAYAVCLACVLRFSQSRTSWLGPRHHGHRPAASQASGAR